MIGKDISEAEKFLQANKLVAIPTETVYGLAGNALSEEAILSIYKAKNRPKFDPLITHTDSVKKIAPLVHSIPEKAMQLADHFWPGPLTILLDKSDKIPDLLTSGLPKIAVRIPNHPLTLKLLKRLNFPLAAPSANPFGYVSPTEAIHVQNQLEDKIDYILDGGRCKVGVESTILGFEKQGEIVIYRLGGTTVEAIEQIVGSVRVKMNNSSNPVAPGMLKSHYSPGKRLLLGDIQSHVIKSNSKSIGVIVFSKPVRGVPIQNQFILSENGQLDEAARNVFKALRWMDRPEVDTILADFLPEKDLGRAINDRLRRAAV